MCMVDEHKNHNTVSAAAERTEKQKHVDDTQRKFQQKIQERQKELEELREAVESHKRSAQAAVEDSERIFTELIRSIERSRSEVTQLIRDQEKAEMSQTEGRLKRIEQEIEDLRRRDAELEQLSHTDNHIRFFQSFQSISVPPGSTNSPSITVSSRLSFDDVGKSVSDLREKLEHFCREEKKKISARVRYRSFPLMNMRAGRSSYNISSDLHWTQTQHINAFICLKGTECLLTLRKNSHIPIIQKDLILTFRCCAERVCVDAVTGRLDGLDMDG